MIETRVLVLAGYHRPELKFGHDVISEFKARYQYMKNEFKNIFFHEVQQNSPHKCSSKRRHGPAKQEINQLVAEKSIDLIIDLHQSDAEDAEDMGLEPGRVKWELCVVDSLQSAQDYVWYNEFIEEYEGKQILKLASLVDPARMPGVTWLGMVAYQGSLRYPGGGEEYVKEVKQVAGGVFDVLRGFRTHREHMKNQEYAHLLEQRNKMEFAVERRQPRKKDVDWFLYKKRAKNGDV